MEPEGLLPDKGQRIRDHLIGVSRVEAVGMTFVLDKPGSGDHLVGAPRGRVDRRGACPRSHAR